VKISGQQILCVGFADWETEVWTNQHHLMSRLARENDVLFVESLGLRRPTLSGRDRARIVRRLRRGLGGVRELDGVRVLSPLVVPLHSNRGWEALNAVLLRAAVGRAVQRVGFRRPLLWAYVPHALPLIDLLHPKAVVYHCVDDIAAQPGVDGPRFRALEERFLPRTNLVLASSQPLYERFRARGAPVVYAPNVADTAHFATALEPGRVDPAIAALPRPRVVFVGTLVSTKVDFKLLAELADRRPQWSWVLVGPVGLGEPRTDLGGLAERPNVHHIGSRPYGDLPQVLRGADAAIIPYRINKLTESVFPMKVYEYLAAGLGVVATDLPSLRGLAEVRLAADPDAFLAGIEETVANDSVEARKARSAAATNHSWERRLEEIATALRQACGI
jgi:glycosyltransferase involved in cell wall biosynthesis